MNGKKINNNHYIFPRSNTQHPPRVIHLVEGRWVREKETDKKKSREEKKKKKDMVKIIYK